ncbi:MAG TPA: hypothetical protein VF214_10135 [Edaphobacter sp.]
MSPVAWLRVAAVLTLIHAVLHTIGGVYGAIPPGPATVAVTAMKANEFVAFGEPRTFWMFYHGSGLGATVFLTLSAVVLWLLGYLVKHDGALLRPVVLVFALGFVALAVVSWQFFFWGPVIAELLIAACLVMAAVGLRKEEPVAKDSAQRVSHGF